MRSSFYSRVVLRSCFILLFLYNLNAVNHVDILKNAMNQAAGRATASHNASAKTFQVGISISAINAALGSQGEIVVKESGPRIKMKSFSFGASGNKVVIKNWVRVINEKGIDFRTGGWQSTSFRMVAEPGKLMFKNFYISHLDMEKCPGWLDRIVREEINKQTGTMEFSVPINGIASLPNNPDVYFTGVNASGDFLNLTFSYAPVDKWTKYIAEGRDFYLVLDKTPGAIGTIRKGLTYRGWYKNGSFTAQGVSTRSNNMIATYSNANLYAHEISVWGALFRFDAHGTVWYKPNGVLVGHLEEEEAASGYWTDWIRTERLFKVTFDKASSNIGTIARGRTYNVRWYSGAYGSSGVNTSGKSVSAQYALGTPGKRLFNLWGAQFRYDEEGNVYYTANGALVGTLSR